MPAATHVLFAGIDGVRWDVIERLPTPALDRVAAAGFLVPVQVNRAAATVSGPSWATMLTGVLASAHGIAGNDLRGNRLAEFPDVIARAAAAIPGIQTFAGAAWPPLVCADSGGPIVSSGGFVPEPAEGVADGPDSWDDADQQVTDRAALQIAGYESAAGSITFSYQLGVDNAGHLGGVDECYREMVLASDRRLGQLLDAVESRPTRASENWLVVVATDHGHLDGGGHGGDDPLERTAWIGACGAGITPGLTPVLEQADVAAHILHVLGFAPADGQFYGVPFGTRPQH